MIFQRYQESGIYLAQADINNPGAARVGFLFDDPTIIDPTYELTQSTWVNPPKKGYFVFFAPSSARDWGSFTKAIRNIFQANFNSELGWFAEDGTAVKPVTLIPIGRESGSNPVVNASRSWQFRNVSLNLVAIFTQPAIIFDDGADSFQIANPASSLQLSVQVPGGPQVSFNSISQNLLLPMTGQKAASVNAAFQFATPDLALFETGFMYFGPGSTPAEPFIALKYPLLRAPGGAPNQMNFSAWLDVLHPLVDTRSFFQCTDSLYGCYFVTSNGSIFALRSNNGSDVSKTSRLVFANRPVNDRSLADNYYLAPAGNFTLAIDSAGSSVSASAPVSADLLCGTTGTEFLRAAISSGADALYFAPSQPARSIVPSSSFSSNDPIFLESGNGIFRQCSEYRGCAAAGSACSPASASVQPAVRGR